MIHLTAAQGKYYFSDIVILLSGQSTDVDEQTLTLNQLEGLKDGYQTKRLLISLGDYEKLLTALESKTSSGGGGKVGSVNGEIGEVILDASEIDFTSGGSIEEKFGDLSPVAFSGSYLDLSNRPGGTGEPFVVVPWNPYRQELTNIDYSPNNASTEYTTGQISKKIPDMLDIQQIDVGYPNSPEISLVNGSPTIITVSPTADQMLTKTLCINTVKSIFVRPLDAFENNGSIAKGVTFSFFIVQLEANEDLTTMPIQDIIGKPRNISVNFSNIYLNEYNNYSAMSYSITTNGNTSVSDNYVLNRDNTSLHFKIDNNDFSIGNGWGGYDLLEFGFEQNKRYGAIFICQSNSSSFDVTTPFSVSISELVQSPEVVSDCPDIAEIKVNKNSKLYIGFEGPQESNDYFGINLNEDEMNLNYMTPNGTQSIESFFIDGDGNISLKLEGNNFKFKNLNTNEYVTIYTKYVPYVRSVIGVNDNSESGIINYTFDLIEFKKTLLLNGVLPNNVIDGSVLFITQSGKFADKDLLTNDYIQLYDNKTNFILNRLVDVNPIVDGKLTTLAGQGLKYDSNKLALNLAFDSGLEYVNDTQLKVISNFTNKYFNYPSLFSQLSEQAVFFNQSQSISLDLSNGNYILVCRVYPYGETYFNNVNLDTSAFGMAIPVGKTVTMLFKDFTDQSYITWPSQFVWADGNVPEIEVGKKILVTGIVIGTQWESYTDFKLLCTYSVF